MENIIVSIVLNIIVLLNSVWRIKKSKI